MQALVPRTHAIAYPKAPIFRRVAADLIDRIVPLPFLAHLFWPWAFICLAYDLLADTGGASVGKRLLGIEVRAVAWATPGFGRCSLWRSVVRNLPSCAARLCYTSVTLAPVGLAIDVLECLLVAGSPTGRRLGDLLAGTQVTAQEAPR